MNTQDMKGAIVLKPLLPVVLMALVVSVLVMVFAAGRHARTIYVLAAVLFVVQMIFAMLRVNRPLLRDGPKKGNEEILVTSVISNSVLTALIYAWGAVAMLAVYSLSGLSWRHGWQYGAAMGFIAIGIFVHTGLLNASASRLRSPRALTTVTSLGALQGIAMIAAMAYLLLSGKLTTPRSDWAANIIFFAGSGMIALLSLVSVLTYRQLTKGPGS